MKRLLLLVVALFVVNISSGQDNIKYHAEWDAGFDITSPWGGFILPTIHTIHGVRFDDRFSVGAGVGYNVNLACKYQIMPLYANVKYILPSKKRSRPFVSADIGYSAFLSEAGPFWLAGLYLSPAIGVKKGKFKFQIGYTAQQLRFAVDSKYFYHFGHIRFGMMF